MGIYNFRDNNTGEEWTDEMSMDSKDKFLAKHPHIEQLISRLNIGDSTRLGIRKPDEGFRDILRNINANVPGAKVNII